MKNDHEHMTIPLTLSDGNGSSGLTNGGRLSVTKEQLADCMAASFAKLFDRSFKTTVRNNDEGKIVITAVEAVEPGDYMTIADVAVKLKRTKSAIRQLTKTRTQQNSRNPLPMSRIAGQLMISVVKFNEWIAEEEACSQRQAPAKGRRKSSSK